MINENAFELDAGGCVAIPAHITLRDWFAAMAIPALIASNDSRAKDRIKDLPEYAYAIADAMIKEREKSK